MTKLNLYGKPLGHTDNDPILELHEVSIGATPKGLRKLAAHLKWAADQMEKADPEDIEGGWHVHFQSKVIAPEIVVHGYLPMGKIVYDESSQSFIRESPSD